MTLRPDHVVFCDPVVGSRIPNGMHALFVRLSRKGMLNLRETLEGIQHDSICMSPTGWTSQQQWAQ